MPGQFSGDELPITAFAAEFPLFHHAEVDFIFPNAGYFIGLDGTMPSECKRRVAAALISYQIRNKSVDYTLRRYLGEVKYPESNRNRLDRRIRYFIDVSLTDFSKYITRVAEARSASGLQDTLGHFLSGWTLSRTAFSFEIIAYASQRGALFEASSLMRMLLGQTAWAYEVDMLTKVEQNEYSATKAIGKLKTIAPSVWRFYGWLSSHAHWTYDAHKKSIVSGEKDEVGHMLASSYFKALSFAAMLVLLNITVACALKMYCGVEEAIKNEYLKLKDINVNIRSYLKEILAIGLQDEDLIELASFVVL